MDMKKFVSSLDGNELEDLFIALSNERKSRYNLSNSPPLSEIERKILEEGGYVKAILAYRSRTNMPVLTCKMVIETYYKDK